MLQNLLNNGKTTTAAIVWLLMFVLNRAGVDIPKAEVLEVVTAILTIVGVGHKIKKNQK